MGDIKQEPMIETARRVMAEHRETLEALHRGSVEAAPESAYAPEDRAFYKFWYAHMKDDQMQPPLSGVRHTDARYIWNAAAKQAAELERERCQKIAEESARSYLSAPHKRYEEYRDGWLDASNEIAWAIRGTK